MSKPILTFCSRTLQHFRQILRETKHERILVGVKGGGCNGMRYYVEPTSGSPEKLDVCMDIDGVPIVLCKESVFHMLGTRISWKENLMGSGLEFDNPNAKSTCGCGETFSI